MDSPPPLDSLKASSRRVQRALREAGLPLQVVELPSSTRTAAEAAQSIGCRVEHIAKAIVFRGQSSQRAVVVLASGGSRIDEASLSDFLGEKVEKGDAAFVRRRTGYVIGGVAPCDLPSEVVVLVDQTLLAFELVWAAAGTPNSVFALSPDDLLQITRGRVVNVQPIP